MQQIAFALINVGNKLSALSVSMARLQYPFTYLRQGVETPPRLWTVLARLRDKLDETGCQHE